MLQKSKKILFSNVKITTLDSKFPNAEALCICNDKIEALGSLQDMKNYLKEDDYTEIDCGGKYMYPGFIDTHSHLTMYGKLLNWVFCGPPSKTVADVLKKIADKAKNTPKGEWVLGFSFDDSGLEDNRHLTVQELDAISTEHPIMIYHITSHMGYVNSLAMKKAEITTESQIAGGEYGKDEDGQLNGFLLEHAFFATQKYLPSTSKEELYEGVKKAIYEYNKKGFTTFFDGGLGFGGNAGDCIEVLTKLNRNNELNARGYLQFLPNEMEKLLPFGLNNFGNEYIKIGGLKYFTDGSIQIRTAALLEDYYNCPGMKGEMIVEVKDLEDIVEKYHSQNVQVAIHANGDGSAEAVIRAIEKAYAKNPVNLRHLLIHAQLVTDSQLERMKVCGIIPSFFTRHVEIWGDRHANLFLGPERVERLDPAGSAVRLGMAFSMHVDTPVLPITALENMSTAVNRTSTGGKVYGENQKISPLEALKAFTTYAAICGYYENELGQISTGYYADLVLLDEDLLTIDPKKIASIKVLKTISGGRIVYDAEQ